MWLGSRAFPASSVFSQMALGQRTASAGHSADVASRPWDIFAMRICLQLLIIRSSLKSTHPHAAVSSINSIYLPLEQNVCPWTTRLVRGDRNQLLLLLLPRTLSTFFANPLLSSIAKSLPLLTAHPPAKLQPLGLRCKVCRVEI